MNDTQKLYDEYLDSSGITTDSRKAENNMLFFALKGDNFDGNKFAHKALQNGCRLAIIDDPSQSKSQGTFLVDDTLKTLQDLSVFHRKTLKIPVIGITGSNGKTTTKELIQQVLSRKYRTIATRGNLNNHIGVPLTILSIKNEEIAIVEMGANHPGEIDFLCRIALPNYGIITNIGKAHLEGFGSFEGVKKTKSELYRYLDEKEGIIFINGSNEILNSLSDLKNIQKIYYMDGTDPVCDGYVVDSGEKLEISLKFYKTDESHTVKMNLSGAYNLENILAAACIGSYFGVEPDEVTAGLAAYKSTKNRSEYIKTAKNQVLLDAYNANPTSMRESLKNFASLKKEMKKIAVLGDMLEMGEYSSAEHKSLLEEIKTYGFDEVYLVGNEFFNFRKQFNYIFFQSPEQIHEHFASYPVKDSLIFLKGSRGLSLEKLLEVL